MIVYNNANSSENFKALVLSAIYGGWQFLPHKAGFDKGDIFFGYPYLGQNGKKQIATVAIDDLMPKNERYYSMQMDQIDRFSNAPTSAKTSLSSMQKYAVSELYRHSSFHLSGKPGLAVLDKDLFNKVREVLEKKHPGEYNTDEAVKNAIALYVPNSKDFYANCDKLALTASLVCCSILNNPKFSEYHNVLPEVINSVNQTLAMANERVLQDAHEFDAPKQESKDNMPKTEQNEIVRLEEDRERNEKSYMEALQETENNSYQGHGLGANNNGAETEDTGELGGR